jgi:hypothetical protein
MDRVGVKSRNGLGYRSGCAIKKYVHPQRRRIRGYEHGLGQHGSWEGGRDERRK